MLLFPGAGSSSTHPGLVAISQAVAPIPCELADFPYRIAGRRAPDRPAVLLDAVRRHAARLTSADPMQAGQSPAGQSQAGQSLGGPVLGGPVLGGRSMGGRICSMAVGDADGPLAAAGLVLISYPLHPPGRPEKLRVEHFPRISVPCLFISGTRDAFGTPDELLGWTASIPAAVTHHWVTGKGHDLKGADHEVAELVAAWVRALPGAKASHPPD